MLVGMDAGGGSAAFTRAPSPSPSLQIPPPPSPAHPPPASRSSAQAHNTHVHAHARTPRSTRTHDFQPSTSGRATASRSDLPRSDRLEAPKSDRLEAQFRDRLAATASGLGPQPPSPPSRPSRLRLPYLPRAVPDSRARGAPARFSAATGRAPLTVWRASRQMGA